MALLFLLSSSQCVAAEETVQLLLFADGFEEIYAGLRRCRYNRARLFPRMTVEQL